jgi:molybdate transport system substrate-binding protein
MTRLLSTLRSLAGAAGLRWRAALWLLPALLVCGPVQAARITVAAAADLKFAMDEIVSAFLVENPADAVETVYGSSGRFFAQIQQGAPYDLFFSADIQYPRELAKAGLAGSAVQAYARGRLVLWSPDPGVLRRGLEGLGDAGVRRIAIANPRHAPYGKRAEEALRAAGLWARVEGKLVYGENVAQTAQMVQSGNAQAGLIALSLALSRELGRHGGYLLLPESLHAPLEQGFVLTPQGARQPLSGRFAAFIHTAAAQAILARWGFQLPPDAVPR